MHSVDLHFGEDLLRSYGCRGCIFKENGQCPHGLSGDGVYTDSKTGENGWCSKIPDFLLSLADSGDSLSQVKEKFHLYVLEMQSLVDRRDMMEIKRRYDELIDTGASSSELTALEIQLNGYKLWWARLSESVVKGFARINDRESRAKGQTASPLTIQQLGRLLKDSYDALESSPCLSIESKKEEGDKDVDGKET